MKLNLIFATSQNNIIGKDGKLPWQLPEDMSRFRRLTKGCPVIMGRKTWDSLPEQFKPLPYRRNIVMSSQPLLLRDVDVFKDMNCVLDMCKHSENVWVIGGKQIYDMFIPIADVLEVTKVHEYFDGDVYGPVIDETWKLVTSVDGVSSLNGLQYSFETYHRV